MTSFSPMTAATEGLRVMRREPVALLGWISLWTLAFLIFGFVLVFTLSHDALAAVRFNGSASTASKLGPLWPLLALIVLTLAIMTTATIFRSVLFPNEHGLHLLRLGSDEIRLAVITAASFVVFGGVSTLFLWLIPKIVLGLFPGSSEIVVDIGTWVTFLLEVWILVRISLVAVHTFAEKRFHLFDYWNITEGFFWRILISYFIVFIQVFLMIGIIALGTWIEGYFLPSGLTQPKNFADRIGLLIEGLTIAFGTASGMVIFLTLFCSCQAVIYAAIVKPDPSSPWGASRRGAWPGRHPRAPRGEV